MHKNENMFQKVQFSVCRRFQLCPDLPKKKERVGQILKIF